MMSQRSPKRKVKSGSLFNRPRPPQWPKMKSISLSCVARDAGKRKVKPDSLSAPSNAVHAESEIRFTFCMALHCRKEKVKSISYLRLRRVVLDGGGSSFEAAKDREEGARRRRQRPVEDGLPTVFEHE